MRKVMISLSILVMSIMTISAARADVPIFRGTYYLHLIDADLFAVCKVWPPRDDTCREFYPATARPPACKSVRIQATGYKVLLAYLARKLEGTPMRLTFKPCSSKVEDVLRTTFGQVCVKLKGRKSVCAVLAHYNEE